MRTRLLAPLVGLLVGCGGDETAPVDESVSWAWTPVTGTQCGNGSETGIGIFRASTSNRLMIHLQEGGACYSASNCGGPDSATANWEGFGEPELASFAAEAGTQGNFDRDEPTNPFRDHHQVLVPYCTGDVHIGDRVAPGDLHFRGQHNFALDLAAIKAAFPDPEQVVLTGSSAGGFGTVYNFWMVADAYPDADLVWVDDSGPPFPMSVMVSLRVVIPMWGLEDTMVEGCDACLAPADEDGGIHNILSLYAERYPGARGSLISSLHDETITARFLVPEELYEGALADLVDTTAADIPDFRVFYLDGSHHTWLDGDEDTGRLADVTSAGTSLSTFLQQQLDRAADWAHVRP